MHGQGRQLPGVVGDRRLRRARRGRDHGRLRRPQGDRPRRRDRRRRGVGARVPQRGQQDRAPARARRRVREITGGRCRDMPRTSTCGVNAEHALDVPASSATRSRIASRRYEVLFELLPERVERVLDLGTGDGITLALVLDARPGRDRRRPRLPGRDAAPGPRRGSPATPRVEIGRHDLDEPLPADLGEFDVGGVELRDPPPRARRASARSTARCSNGCGPGGLFVNVEHVASPTAELPRGVPRRARAQPRTTTIRRTSSSPSQTI